MLDVASRTALIVAAASAALGGCAQPAGRAVTPGTVAALRNGQPGQEASGVRPTAANQAVLDALTGPLRLRPYHTLAPSEARLQPSFADGVMTAAQLANRPVTPPSNIATREIQVAGAAGPLPARLYQPQATSVGAPLPVIVYFHGGGWVIADRNVYDASARALAREANAIVISVDYRRAPEFKFPAQHDDALASYRWAIANAASVGGDPARIALAGESAGGNLAVATAIAARDAGLPAPVHVLSIYPIAGNDLNTASYQENANALPLSRAAMAWFLHHTTRTPADAADPRINLVAANFAGLPPVTIVAAQIDPLRSEGEMLAERLRAAGVLVDRREFARVTHEFFGGDLVIPEARAAQTYAGQRLKTAFGSR
ncbi:alpha/beta hydrolase [Sphingomonas endolithica]|uniref:alpha/beta hydrolase n=1 Tax=Sphingomonas endolithica TaxID=2972485 RepID=UPI0021AE9270|nr:alpha/beta hydrolase [Sphingomonas sp. ZFBP2030]